MTVKNTPTKVPGIGQPPASIDPATRKYLNSIVEAIEIRLGRRGDPRDRAVTLRELINSGLAEELKANKFDPNNITSFNLGMGAVPGPSGGSDAFGTPDTPVNFSATGGYQKVLLSWTAALYLGHSQTEIWRHDSDVLGDAILVGITSGPTYVDNVGGDQSFYYWIRHVSTTNEVGNYNATQGTLATTSPNVTVLLDELAGAITNSELSAVLSGRITDTETGIADLITTYGDTTAAAASAAAALASQTAAAQDAVLTAADVQSTAADVISSAADAASTAADVINTAASAGSAVSEAAAALASANSAAVDATQTALDAASAAADVISTAADAATTTSDAAQTALDVAATAADVISTAADATQTALDAAAAALDKTATNADVVLTSADVVSTAADVIAAASSATDAATSSSASSSSALVAKARSIDAERALKASGSISERICMEPGNYVFAVEQDSTQIYKNGTLLTTLNRGVTQTQTLVQGDKLASSKPFNACSSDNTTLASVAHAGRQFGMHITRDQLHTVRIYPLSDGQAYIRTEQTWDYGSMAGVTPVALTGGTMYSTTADVGSDGDGYLSVRTTCDALVYKHYASGYDHTILNPASERIIIDASHNESTVRMDENGTSSSATIVTSGSSGSLLSTSDLSEALFSGSIGDGDGSDCETHVPYEFLGDEYIVPNVTLSDFCVISPEDDLIVRVYDKDSTLLYTKTVTTAGDRGPEGVQDGTVGITETALSTDGPYYFSGNKPFYLRINLDADEDPVIGYRRDVKALAGNQAAVAATYYASEASASETAAGQEASAANSSAAAANTSAGAALVSENAAATSETNASGSASTASTQAGLATTAKNDAEAAETNAQASESAAASSESNAAGHASTASTQASLATTAKTDAETAETNAQASETNASVSESAAAASVITAAGHASTASTQAGLATTAKTDTDDLKDIVLEENAASGDIFFVNPESWMRGADHSILGDDKRTLGNTTNFTGSWLDYFKSDDPDFGYAYFPAKGLNESVGPRKVHPYTTDKVFLVRVVARVTDDGDTIGTGVRLSLGYNGYTETGGRITADPDQSNATINYTDQTVSDGIFTVAGFIGGTDYTDTQLEALDIVQNNAPSGQTLGRASVTTTGTNYPPSYIGFQLRTNHGGATDGRIAIRSIEVIDVTEAIKAEIQADAAAGSATSASVSESAAASSASTASGHASTASTQAGLATTAKDDAETAETNASASESAAAASVITAAGHASTASTEAGLATTAKTDAETAETNASASESAAAASVVTAAGHASTASQSSTLAASAQTAAEDARDGIVYQNFAFGGTIPTATKPIWVSQGSDISTSSAQAKFGSNSLKVVYNQSGSMDIFDSSKLDFFPEAVIGDKYTWGMWVYIDGSGTSTEVFGFAGDGGWATTDTSTRNQWVFLTDTGTMGNQAANTLGVKLEFRSAPLESNDVATYVDGIIIVKGEVDLTSVEVDDSAVQAAHNSADSAGAALTSSQSATASQTAAGNSAATALSEAALAAASASDASASEGAALISENNAATSESNAAGSQSSASSSSTLAVSAQAAAEAALAVAKVEIAAIGPSRVTPIVENWATQSHSTDLQSGDDRFVGTVALAESHFTTSDSVFGDAYNYNSETTNLTFGPRKAYPYGADKVYMVRVIYRVAVESTRPIYSYGTNTYIGATTRGGDGLTLIENSQPGQQTPNAADGELEFVMVFHGGDYATGSLDSLNIVDSNKTVQDNGVISGKILTSQGAGANGSDAPAEHIGFQLRQNASDASNGTLAVKSFEVFDITDVVLAELKAGEAAVSAAAALVSEGAATASESAAGQSASTASTQAGIATTKAGEASTSASQAATSESNASGHESAASSSETNAANSASDASDSEANALTYRNAAATSASNAAGSESAAATSEGISVAIQDRMNLVDGGVVNAGFEADQASTSIDTWPTGWDCEGQRFDAPRDIGVVDNVVNSTGDFASTKSFGTHVEDAGTTGHWLRLSKYFVAEAAQKFNVDMAVRLAGTIPSGYNRDPEWIDEDDVFIIYNWYDEDGALLSQAAVSSATSEYNQANSSWVSGSSLAPVQTWFDYVSDEGTAPANTAFVRIDLILIDDQPGNIGTDVLVNYATWAVGGNFRGYIDDVQFLSSNGSIVETNKANLEGAVSAAASQTSASNASASESAAGTSASTANTQAGVATTKAGEASTSAGAAATSASNAQGSANTATSQAALATTAKNDAETAETNAQASESAAATSESNAQGHSSTASSQATLAATAKSDTDDLKDAVLVETAANGEIQFVNPTSWQHTQQVNNLYSGDNRFAGDGNATPSFFIDNDAEFGSAYVPTLGLNESVSPRRVQPYSSDKVYLVRLIARVVNDGATIANGVRVTLGINGWKADGTRITSSPDLNNFQPVYVTKQVADGTFELSVFFGGSDYTDAELEAFDLVIENAPAGQGEGRAWAIIPPSTGTNHEPDLAYVNFQVRYNSSSLTDGQIALKTLEVIDVTESIKAEIKADAAAISASAALVSEGAASASQSAAGNSATTSTQQAGIASTKAGDASGFASDASGFATTAQQSASTAAGSASTASTQAGLAATAKNDAESARDSMVLDNIVVDSRLANATLIGGWDTTIYERSTTQKYFGGHSLKSKSTIFGNPNPIFYRTDIPIISGEKFTWGAWVYKNFSANITLQFQQFGGWATGTVTSTNAWQFVTAQGTATSDVATNLEMDIRDHTGGTSRELFIDGLIIVRGHHDLTVVETSDRAATAEVLSEVSAAASLVSSGAASASATTAGDEAAISSQQAGIATTKAGEALTYRDQAAQSRSDASGFSASASQSSGLAVTAKDTAEAARDAIVYQNYAFDGTFPGGVKPQWTDQSSAYTTSTTFKKLGTHSLKILASNTGSTRIFKSYDLDSFPEIAIGDKFTWGMWVYIDGSGTTSEIFGFAGDGGWGTIGTAVRNSWVFLTTTGTAGAWAPVNGLRLEQRSAPIGSNTDNAIYVDGVIVVRGEVDLTSVEVDDSSVRSAHKSSVSASAALASAQSASASESDAGDFASTASTQAGIATTKAGEASSFASTASDSADDAEGFKNTASQASGVAAGHSSTAQGFASASNESAGAAATSATNAADSAEASAVDNRLLEARVNSPLNGHYANSEWYLYNINSAYVVSYFTGTDIRIQNMATGTWYDVKKNATRITNYPMDYLSGTSGIGPWRVSASGPIVCKHGNGHMGVPANFAGTLLGNIANRYQPVDIYLFSPDTEASVDVFASESYTGFNNTMTPNHTITVPAGGFYHWQQDVDWGSTQTGGNTSVLFRSDARVCGIWVPTGGDYMLMTPLTNGEAVGGVETDNLGGYPYYNDGATNTTLTTESDGSARYYVNDDPKFYFMQAATADGAGGDAEFAIPREGLSDYYIWPEPDISNFRMVAVEPGTVKVMQADGTVLYTEEFGASTSTTSPTFLSEGSNTGNTNIHTGIGPYTFVGTVPFHLVCQQAGDDDETTMLGARQSKLAESGAIKAAAVSLNTVSSAVDGQATTIGVQASSIDGLKAQYTVKIDNNGAVAGYGLASTTTSSGNNVSEFIVNADRFAILRDASDTGTAQVPFSVVTTSYTNNGVTVNPGVYIADAFIANGTIDTAKIGNAAIDDAKIANLSASKINTGTLNAANVNISGVTSGIDLKSSASGARMEIKADSIKVFDSSGAVRIKLGNL